MLTCGNSLFTRKGISKMLLLDRWFIANGSWQRETVTRTAPQTVTCLLFLLLTRPENSMKPLRKLKYFVRFELRKSLCIPCLKIMPGADEQLTFQKFPQKAKFQKEKESLSSLPVRETESSPNERTRFFRGAEQFYTKLTLSR